MEQHCREPGDCPFYPLHSCFATERGLICQNRSMFVEVQLITATKRWKRNELVGTNAISTNFQDLGGFEMNPNPIETFVYSPYSNVDDTGQPCFTIPLSDELYSYVDYRGPDVIDQGDLALIGNCSRLSYCDVKTRTCQPKRNVGSPCKHNMECYYGPDILPGHCANHSVCAVRQDVPPYYGAAYHSWTLGNQWQAAVLALIATAAIAFCLVVGRQQAYTLAGGVRRLVEKWRNPQQYQQQYLQQQQQQSHESFAHRFDSQEDPTTEQQRRWWKQMPGLGWVYKRLNRNNSSSATDEAYYPLTARDRLEDPPEYRE